MPHQSRLLPAILSKNVLQPEIQQAYLVLFLSYKMSKSLEAVIGAEGIHYRLLGVPVVLRAPPHGRAPGAACPGECNTRTRGHGSHLFLKV